MARVKDVDDVSEHWMRLLLLGQTNTLSLAYSMLVLIDEPAVATDEIREDLVGMIRELEYGIARFEEYIVD